MAATESRRDAVLGTHREAILRAATRHKALAISLVGSAARGEDHPSSDYDFVATFEPDASLFDLVGLREDLEELLGCSVDVMSAGGLTERHNEVRRDAIAL